MNIELLKALVSATAAGSFMYTSTADHGPLVAAEFAQINAQMVNPDGSGQIATRATPKGTEYVNSLNANASQGQTDFSGQPVNNGGFGNAPVQSQPTQTQPVQQTQPQNPGHGIGQQSAGFTRVSGFVPQEKPKAERSGNPGDGEKYPFSQLAAPVTNADGTKSFDAVFVPSTKYPANDKQGRAGQLRSGDDMAFSLQSACNAATRRFATVAGTETRTIKGVTKQVNKYNHTRKFAVQGGEQNGVAGAFIYREA